MKFWAGHLGLERDGRQDSSRTRPRRSISTASARAASYRTMSAVFPGSRARIEFLEFKGMPRKEFSIRVTDPGASGMAIRVKQIQSICCATLKKEGIRVSSKNGELVEWSATIQQRLHQGPERPEPGARRHARGCARGALPRHAAWPRPRRERSQQRGDLICSGIAVSSSPRRPSDSSGLSATGRCWLRRPPGSRRPCPHSRRSVATSACSPRAAAPSGSSSPPTPSS